MMVHGMAVIPKVWSASIAAPLREYILNRNDNLTSETEIRINPNYRRKAFAIDPVEDPIVQAAVDALVTNPVLKALVAGLTGDADPALMEMTAITSYSGAAIQNWHHDGMCVRTFERKSIDIVLMNSLIISDSV